MEILIITGMSGAGKSQALNQLEDLGYFAMDNLPPQLLNKFVEISMGSGNFNKICIVVDARSGKFFQNLSRSLDELKALNIDYKILFLDANKEVIVNRYKELRRPHPLSNSITKGYDAEKEILRSIKSRADYIIDTSNLKPNELRENIFNILNIEKNVPIKIGVTSFGFKNGILLDGDLIFDVRFLPNPFYIQDLKYLNGENEKTKNYVMKFDVTKKFIDMTLDMLKFLIPNYIKEGKGILSIGIGCTGGFHRSVVITNEIGKELKKLGYKVIINHRDVDL